MSFSYRARCLGLAISLSLLLASCGGGGGNSGSTSTADPASTALASGNAQLVSLPAITSSTQALLATQTRFYSSARQALFDLNSDGSLNTHSISGLSWNPTHDSSWLNVLDSARNQIMLPANWSYTSNSAGDGAALAVVGAAPGSGTRYAAFGGNPLAVPGNAAMDAFMAKTVTWLTPRAGQSGFRIVTAHLPGTESYWFNFEGAVRNWFASHYAGVTINGLAPTAPSQRDNICDGAALAVCLQNADLLVIGRDEGSTGYDGNVVMNAVSAAQARGVPVLYLHHYRDAGDLATRLLGYFGLSQSSNYWNIEGLSAFSPATLPALPPQLAGYTDLVTRLTQGTFSTDWSGCTSAPLAAVNCSTDTTFMNEFGTLTGQLRNSLRQLDANGTVLFATSGYELEKRLVLLGDKLRESVAYPLDKTANKQEFLRALFSDVATYVHRPYASVAENLGNFSGPIPASTPAVSRQLMVTLPTSGTRDYLTGLYVMPGRSVTLTRSDNSGATVTFGLNMLRDTTRAFDNNGLDRPKLISSPRMPLASGHGVTITSPYGGPLLLFLDAASGSTQTVTVQVEGATTHPVLRDATDPTQVAEFQAEVASTPTNWVAITSDTLTLHSTLAHFRQTMSAYGNDMSHLAGDMWLYTIKDTYELAGLNSASGRLQLAPSVTAFCTSRGWDCSGMQHRRDIMQHAISDVHAQCGDGCSGNPFDFDWAFGPLGWGETHEIGHNLQRTRLKIYGGQSTEVSNNIFPMHKQMHYNLAEAPASPYVARAGSVKVVFNDMMAALQSGNPSAAMTSAIWTDTSYAANNSERVAFYRQLVEYARYYNSSFTDGWELYPLLYLLDRNVDANAANWPAVAASYGFSTYTSYPSTMNGNDFMVVATSFIIGKDMRPVFDLWGVSYSSAASSQVATFGYAAAPKLLFPMRDLDQPAAGVGTPIVIAAGAQYPAGY